MSEGTTNDAEDTTAWSATFLLVFVDHLMPLLKPYEASLYLYLYRHTHANDTNSVRVGIRTISRDLGVGTRSPSGGNIQHIREVLTSLEEKGCITVGDRTREGTLYTVQAPHDIEGVKERLATVSSPSKANDFFRDPELRRFLFERDGWRCEYCGDLVTEDTATLDHRAPVSKGGKDSPENLTTACLLCNSLKSGKTIEEAAPLILASVRARRRKDEG